MPDVILTEASRDAIEQIAIIREITFDEAIDQLFSEGLKQRMGQVMPAIKSNILEFRSRK